MKLKQRLMMYFLCFWTVSAFATVCYKNTTCYPGGVFNKNICQKEVDGVVTGVISQMEDYRDNESKITSTKLVLTVLSWQKKPIGIPIPAKIPFKNDNCMTPRIHSKVSDKIRIYFKIIEHNGMRYYWVKGHEVLSN